MLNNSTVAIIIVNWKKYELTRSCINSVEKSSFKNVKIILVDNEYHKDKFHKINKNLIIHIIKNKINEGFAKASNQGIKYALKNNFDYIMLLNNDTIVKEDLLELLIDKSIKFNHKIIQPLILNYNGTKIWNGGGSINYFFGNFNTLNKGKTIKDFKNNNDFTEWFTGCCIMFKSEVFNKVGFLDENFFAYYEDVDFSIRLKKYGYKIYLMNDSYLFHIGSSSSKSKNKTEGNLSPYVHYLNIRNHIYILKKHMDLFNKIGVFIFQFIKIYSYLVYFLMRLRFNKFKTVIKGVNDALKIKK